MVILIFTLILSHTPLVTVILVQIHLSFPSIRAAWSKSFAPIHRLATATHPSTQRPRLPDALVFRRAPRPTELHLLEARVAGWAGVVGHQCIMGLCGF